MSIEFKPNLIKLGLLLDDAEDMVEGEENDSSNSRGWNDILNVGDVGTNGRHDSGGVRGLSHVLGNDGARDGDELSKRKSQLSN